MGYFRFRKSFSILPGVKINLSKTGLSTSLGGHGATVNIGKNGPNATIGAPGTGLSYRTPVTGLLLFALLAVAAIIGVLWLVAPGTIHTLLHWWQPRWF